MGLLDKVKDKATQATEMAKDAAAKGQAKLDEAQAKKAADGMLRDLGAAFYATKTGRATPTTDGDIERLVAALQQHESEHGATDAGARVRRGRPDGSPGRRCRRIGSAAPSATAPGCGPRLTTTTPSDRADPVGRRSGARRGAADRGAFSPPGVV